MDNEDKKEAFHQRLKFLIGNTPPFNFARKVGIPNATFARILSDKTIPKYDHLCKIAQKCAVSLDWLMTGGEPVDLKSRNMLIPLKGIANCGLAQGWFNENESGAYLFVSGKDETREFAVLCRGSSMKPMGIEDGDVCIVAPDLPAQEGRPALIRTRSIHKGKECELSSVKRYDGVKNGNVCLTGWLEADDSGRQDSFCEQRRADVVVFAAPVVRILKKSAVENVFSDSFKPDESVLEKCFEDLKPYLANQETKSLAKLFSIFYEQNLKK